ncbi:MAG: acyltransferase [Campylobacteraceae bacterium]|jgi:peptidoglycan/LPS O-acetylase OafA/YrhL|nr:acyltransferase [Campylobacteraceae bacterium]MBT3882944.1 acyltransferase [Campylobacteraceae bacterium]MBT4179283.1 acyltransferase [Campylobacteraceae bacterium]MBT5323915.1 acyltransferase [Campylobacteraceae bacterium]MBT6388435.1 acyltransferase [Campylobacteraceae bacterium]
MKFLPIVNHSLKYNQALDGLRGIAILLVLLFHIWPEHFSFGYVGVDIFFVLSGFLITQIIITKLDSKSFSFKEFYRNRIRRIFPTMILVITVALLVGYLILLPNELGNLGKHAKSSLWFFQNFRLISEVGYWDQAAQLKPLLHFWSLSVEEQFYLFWPLVLLIIYKIPLNSLWTLIIVLISLILIPYFIELEYFYHSLARFWELAFGGFIYLLSTKVQLEKLLNKFQLLIYLIFLVSIFLAFDNTQFNFFKTLAIVISSGLLLVLLIHNSEQRFFASKPLVFLGLISFPLYLWHYVIIGYVNILNLDIYEYSIYIISLSILLSYLTYRYVEIYFRKQDSFKLAYSLFGVVLFLGLISQYFYAKKGLPNRGHLEQKEQLSQQFEKMPHKNDQGKSLISKILGTVPNNDYIRATSDDLTKQFVLLVGDSHAHTSYRGFADEFKKQGIETLILANSGCGPYRDKLEDNSLNIECKKKIQNIHALLKKVENIESIKDVIFITRAAKLEYITSLFEEFSKKNTNLYYLIENPPLDFSPDVCIERPFGISKVRDYCGVKYKKHIQENLKYRNIVIETAKKYQNIISLDPIKLFCDEEYCYAIRDDIVLYSDTNHHSVMGSKLQGKYLIDKIIVKDKENLMDNN